MVEDQRPVADAGDERTEVLLDGAPGDMFLAGQDARLQLYRIVEPEVELAAIGGLGEARAAVDRVECRPAEPYGPESDEVADEREFEIDIGFNVKRRRSRRTGDREANDILLVLEKVGSAEHGVVRRRAAVAKVAERVVQPHEQLPILDRDGATLGLELLFLFV